MNNQDEKAAFVAALTKKPCDAGRDAFLAHEGSIEDYFDTHERGAGDLLWCIGHGLMAGRWAYIVTRTRFDACAKKAPWSALEYAAAYHTQKSESQIN